MSLVLPLPPQPRSPHHLPLSRSGSPSRSRPLSRASTPPRRNHVEQPLSAPSTPVTSTHLMRPDLHNISMERCRSSEPYLEAHRLGKDKSDRELRGGRTRGVKATSLLFKSVPSSEDIRALEQVVVPELIKGLGEERIEDVQADSKVVDEANEITLAPLPVVEQPEQLPASQDEEDDRMDIDEPFNEVEEHKIWGMPRWGCEDERKEVGPGVRLINAEELSDLVEQHAMIDTPSHVMFPWLHGISDDGRKGIDMAAFFGLRPPFQPPSYRGLSLMICPSVLPGPAHVDTPSSTNSSLERSPTPGSSVSSASEPERPPLPHRTASQSTAVPQVADVQPSSAPPETPVDSPRERSATVSTTSDSYMTTSDSTEATSPSIAESDQSPPHLKPTLAADPKTTEAESPSASGTVDVQMHPCESKRTSTGSSADQSGVEPSSAGPSSPGLPDSPGENVMENGPLSTEPDALEHSCYLLNTLHVEEIFELPICEGSSSSRKKRSKGEDVPAVRGPRFRKPKLPAAINLRNLNIQQIKYSTISDIILYHKKGINDGVLSVAEQIAQAQEVLWHKRMDEFYQHVQDGEGEGINRPVRYGVWVVIDPFTKIEALHPHLVSVDSKGQYTPNQKHVDLFSREMLESHSMTKASQVCPGFWVGHSSDVPTDVDGVAQHDPRHYFDLCVHASEAHDMPTTSSLRSIPKLLGEMDARRAESRMDATPSKAQASAAAAALRKILSPPASPAEPTPANNSYRKRRRSPSASDHVQLPVAGSSRTWMGMMRNLTVMTERVVETVYCFQKLIEGREDDGQKRTVLVHCQDGYTESTIITLAYVMSAQELTLPEAYVYLQNTAKRSFFLFASDKNLLRRVDNKLASDRRARAAAVLKAADESSSRWRKWATNVGRSLDKDKSPERTVVGGEFAPPMTLEEARRLAEIEEKKTPGDRALPIWWEDKRFDGFPSRILPFLYLGNLEHAGNAMMLEALQITHVVSVGESLINCPRECDPMHGPMGANTLREAEFAGRIQVLDLTDVRDDGNDPLRPLIARACAYIEAARQEGGTVLVHCRVGVSRSASIVMAYMMQYHGMGLMDAYMMTRARRLNVLIQPNLRFFHELFGWEVELARREAVEGRPLTSPSIADIAETRESRELGMVPVAGGKRRIVYTWPSFCRDVYCLNRRFLCN